MFPPFFSSFLPIVSVFCSPSLSSLNSSSYLSEFIYNLFLLFFKSPYHFILSLFLFYPSFIFFLLRSPNLSILYPITRPIPLPSLTPEVSAEAPRVALGLPGRAPQIPSTATAAGWLSVWLRNMVVVCALARVALGISTKRIYLALYSLSLGELNYP